MSAAHLIPSIHTSDRLGLAIVFAGAVHALAVFGLGINNLSEERSRNTVLDVVLVQTAADKPPEAADLIAQANQHASGRSDTRQRPSHFTAGLSTRPSPGLSPTPVPQDDGAAAPISRNFVVQNRSATHSVATDSPKPSAEGEIESHDRSRSRREQEIARLTSELAQRQRLYAQRPRINYVDTLSAKTAVEAAYLKHWVGRVEQVGNLNYPDQARRNRLNGSLILHVLLDHEGRLVSVKVGGSSGEQILDDAARRIVQMASPFKPFPDEMRATYDQLMITRTWVFRSGQSLITR